MSDRRGQRGGRDPPRTDPIGFEKTLLGWVWQSLKWFFSTRVGKFVAVLLVLNLLLWQVIGRWADLLTLVLGVVVVGTVVATTAIRWLPMNVSLPMLGGGVSSGRESFQPGLVDDLRWWLTSSSTKAESLDVDYVLKKHPDAPPRPVLDDEVSEQILGQTNTGKSTFAKKQLEGWEDSSIIAHALSEPGERNELAEFFRALGSEVFTISSQDSDVRWDPFLDSDGSLRSMENITAGVFESRDVVETGWSESARSLLLATLFVTYERHGDFASLDEVLAEGPESIIEALDETSNTRLVQSSLAHLDTDARGTVYSTLLNRLRPLLATEIFDEDLPRISFTDFFESSGNQVLVLDNIREDTVARGFWRFFIESAIDRAFSAEAEQRFILDEVDKLPAIANLDDLASAGRSPGALGILMAQDVHQLENHYGNMAKSIWSNSPNRICFSTGDSETAASALSSLGETELEKRSKSTDCREIAGERTSTSVADDLPLTTGELVDLDPGEALIQSPEG
jgi:hypothetical protein